jgi:gluconate kinase
VHKEITLHAKAGGALDCVQIYAANRSTINNLHNPHSSRDNQHEIWICQVGCQVMFIDLDSGHVVSCSDLRRSSRSIFSMDSFMHNST